MKSKRYRKTKWISGIMAVIIALGLFGYYNRTTLAMWGFDVFLSGQVKNKLEDSYKPLEGREMQPVSYENKEPFSVLLLGVDQRDKEVGRSDTMIVSVVRPADGAILMVSIPRDTYTEIVGKDKMDKITHAYAFGGAKMSIETVEKLLDTHINHYASINFTGFREVIDAMGGISLPIEQDIENKEKDHEKFTIKANQPVYNGTDALNFVRYREDAGGDVSRAGRHQVFLNAMMDKASQVSQWSSIPDYISIMGDNFSTDMTPDMMIGLAKTMLQADGRTIYSHTLKGDGHRKESGGAWYFFANEEDVAQTKQLITSWLDPSIAKSSLPLPSEYAAKNKPVQSLSAGVSTKQK
ncbi:cell envelope-related transcriptional attenuator [Paenibacillus curdlanolyticus YK9]|uniref:Cell envelope-related transcriptional attenuator n=1 Tax=Paenibacillus curdlanolyticus YK9 TaxID=717606 RepID=E0I9A6_9BACL|nr:LCP family protein [Paenibacillus curdlanolyticus]EFM10990.1 cell envelope-related transcriptional attenuator [Paenibacillus curdlanolyticus YK9]